MRDGLAHTVGLIHGEHAGAAAKGGVALNDPSAGSNQHVTGQQLCMGLRDLALRRWGRLAALVLYRWGIHRTEDFGIIVYDMIDRESMRPSLDDSFEDFRDVYDFEEAFAPDSVTGPV